MSSRDDDDDSWIFFFCGAYLHTITPSWNKVQTMKFSTAFLLAAPAAAFAPGATMRHSAPLQMSSEAATESKVIKI